MTQYKFARGQIVVPDCALIGLHSIPVCYLILGTKEDSAGRHYTLKMLDPPNGQQITIDYTADLFEDYYYTIDRLTALIKYGVQL